MFPQLVPDRAGPGAHRVWGEDDAGCEAKRVSRDRPWNAALLQEQVSPFGDGRLWDVRTNARRRCQSKSISSVLTENLTSYSVPPLALCSAPSKLLRRAAHGSVTWPIPCTHPLSPWNMLMKLETCLSVPSTTCSLVWALSCTWAWLSWSISPVDVWGAGQFHQTRNSLQYFMYAWQHNIINVWFTL